MPDTTLPPTAPLTCFKAYDIRGRVPDELNEDVAYRVGRAFVQELGAGRVVVGRDIRLSSPGLLDALVRGINEGGADAYDIGLAGTEEIYFNTFHHRMDGGIVVTASHNPMDYNGMKLVREGSRPISGDTGLGDIKARAERGDFTAPAAPGTRHPLTDKAPYIDHLLGYVDVARLKPLKVVVNAGNGGAGPVIDLLEDWLPFELVKVHHAPDGSFPNGIPNPLLPENRDATVEAIKRSGADMGVAWDGDFDRCFLFDERGGFIEGYYIVGLLAELFLIKEPGAKIIHDPRLTWNTIDMVEQAGGVPVQSKTGHAFIKERMRLENAVYGGEMSAHHYFRDFAYCDSGMIPWLVVAELMCREGRPLSSLVAERQARYPVSGEINRRLPDPADAMARVEAHYRPEARAVEYVDGLSMAFDDWRFNLRMSNTEPLLRLNVESRADPTLMQARTDEILAMITPPEV